MMMRGRISSTDAMKKGKPFSTCLVAGYRLLNTPEASSVQLFSSNATKANKVPANENNEIY